MNFLKKLFFLMLGVIFLGFSQVSTATEELKKIQSEISVQILGINDFHGAITDAPYLSSNLARERNSFIKQNPAGVSMSVQSGDMVGSSPANSSLLQDEPTIKAMNRMNFDYGTLGNHEFDEGLEEFDRILTGVPPKKGIFNVETEMYPREMSTQQMLIANIRKRTDQSVPYNWKPYAIKKVISNKKEVSIGFIGIVTKDIPNLVSKKYYEEYSFLDEAETIEKYSRELRNQGVNAIVVLAHTGRGEEIVDKLNQIDSNNSVDIVFDGHSHKEVNSVKGTTRIVQSLSSARAFSSINGNISLTTKDFIGVPSATIKKVDKTVPKDSVVEEIVEDADQRVQKLSNQIVGYATTPITISKKENKCKESALGNLIADAQLTIANKEGFIVDGALVNSGSLRTDLLVGSDRSIKYGDALQVQPFGNPLYVVQLTGKQLTEILNKQYQNNQKNPLQISGISYQYINYYESNQPYIVTKLLKKDKNISSVQKITVVVNEYVYTSNVFNPLFEKGQLLGVLKANDSEALMNYFMDKKEQNQSISAKIENRKQYTPFVPVTDFSYRTHVQDYGWQVYAKNGKSSGTTGKSKRLEAIQIKLESSIEGNIQYKTHIQDYGWQSWRENNALSGTTGKSKRLEAIQIKLSGSLSNYYDIHYRVHCQDYGWLGWAKNGQSSGTQGFSKRLEAIQIKIVPNGTHLPTNNRRAFIRK